MAENKKYFYLKFKENFFDSDKIIYLESLPDGYLFCNILLKLYLKSLKDDGRLMLNDQIPYDTDMIAKITRHKKKTVEKALDVFTKLGLIERLESGAIYMTDIQEFIGKSSTEAERKKQYRNRIKEEEERQPEYRTNVQTNDGHSYTRDKSLEFRDENTLYNPPQGENATPVQQTKRKRKSRNQFNNFSQRDYDYNDLERQLINSDLKENQ